MHFGHTNYCFVSYFAPGDAPLVALHPRCTCSCMQLPRGCNLRPRRTTRFGTRRNVTPAFCSRPRAAAPPSTVLLFPVSVSHVCAFRVHGYLECTLCPEALRTAVCRDIFVYAGNLDNSISLNRFYVFSVNSSLFVIFYL